MRSSDVQYELRKCDWRGRTEAKKKWNQWLQVEPVELVVSEIWRDKKYSQQKLFAMTTFLEA